MLNQEREKQKQYTPDELAIAVFKNKHENIMVTCFKKTDDS